MLAGILLILNAFAFVAEDRTAPEIIIPDSLIEKGYEKGEEEEDLLKGVTAQDNRDGDVSDSLRVADILENGDGKSVTVTYMAKDAKKNVASESIVLKKKAD